MSGEEVVDGGWARVIVQWKVLHGRDILHVVHVLHVVHKREEPEGLDGKSREEFVAKGN